MNSHTLRRPRSNCPRFVLGSTRLTIALLITGLGGGGILLAQRGIFALFGGHYQAAWMPGLLGIGLMCAAFVIARYRDDLVDD